MNELSHQSQVINLQLSIRNLNGVPLDVQNINVSLSAKDELLFSYNGPAQTNIVANGTEVWAMQDEEREAGRVLLDKLQSGDINSLPYTLKGSVTSVEDGTLNFEHTGHIYNVPGRSGHFR
jgi:outer membrane lipoprotein-sorting protein